MAALISRLFPSTTALTLRPVEKSVIIKKVANMNKITMVLIRVTWAIFDGTLILFAFLVTSLAAKLET